MCERECLHSEREGLSPDFKESEDVESFEMKCVYGQSLDYGNKHKDGGAGRARQIILSQNKY